jgi:hypothetical protein
MEHERGLMTSWLLAIGGRPPLSRGHLQFDSTSAIVDQMLWNVDVRSFLNSGHLSRRRLGPLCAKTGSQAYVEMLREAVLHPQDAHDAELSAEFVELMRKIAA